ncbi:MAG: hypothetical protein ACKO0V_16310 [bacterium]
MIRLIILVVSKAVNFMMNGKCKTKPLKLLKQEEVAFHFSRETLHSWISSQFGICVAQNAVCDGHHAPWDFLSSIIFDRPSLSLALGGRGTGKSFLTALGTHLINIWHPNHRVRILGGSMSQSRQIYEALQHISRGMDSRNVQESKVLSQLMTNRGSYRNGSEVMILPASSTSVRGPHIPTLLLDEVDEIKNELRESAMGMCMNIGNMPAATVMTSTWHRVGGPMSELVARGEANEFPFFRFCIFEVMERCSETRSGPNLEKCPSCPLVQWCHDVKNSNLPKAKRSNGHYSIDAVIQKVKSVSRRVFEADYLCMGPKSDGRWFTEFQKENIVSAKAEFNPSLPVHLTLDSGVVTGALLFQIEWKNESHNERLIHSGRPSRQIPEVHVFGELLTDGLGVERNAIQVREMLRTLCMGRVDHSWTDPAGSARTAIGPTVIAEYERLGMKLSAWPSGSVSDSLSKLESLINPAIGPPKLLIHPRCDKLISAFENYRRAKRGGQWQDYPEDPQHPHEDLIDALRCGLRAALPEGSSDLISVSRISARKVF